ncbi:MAG: hypothetical protein JRH13_05080 [Deltaproteobacteria bacterium]|nr:hypothetical protein [Deltaproteobacteria bacterium]MBW2016537.1 hypothetical protein [Deltaproteobacteria bacterium]MBW2128717.1 hypothetical protein [Deltaproteobacteria bacterium]MBW2302401.1 hypothetical protein [Deltaproteobacteria bacterium]
MESQPISSGTYILEREGKVFRPLPEDGSSSFKAFLGKDDPKFFIGPGKEPQGLSSIPFSPGAQNTPPVRQKPVAMAAASAYRKHQDNGARLQGMTDIQKYKDDQLLSNPGGDAYYLDRKEVLPDDRKQESFWGRIGKDLSDAFGNVKNFFKNLLFGSKIHYRDEKGRIREATQRGLLGSVVDFFKDLGSALSFGAWRPDGEESPGGAGKRVVFFFSKLKEAVFGDLLQGGMGSVIHMGEDLLFAGWNLLETVPDATIGNFKAGKELTTRVFDDGQVILDYLTDILPSGEAWVRVHSWDLKKGKPPIILNSGMPEQGVEDSRWKYVRNTPFRKAIETIGSLFTDILTLRFLGQIKLFGEDRHQKN